MKKVFPFLFILWCGLALKDEVWAQPTWARSYGGNGDDYANSIVATDDGEYIIAGLSFSFVADSDIWVVKLNAFGDIQWQRTFGGTTYDYGYGVSQSADGGYIVAGSTRSFGSGNHDAIILKLDTNGNPEWEKVYGGPGYDYAFKIIQTSDSGYIWVGSTDSFGAGSSDIWLLKLDSAGNIQWQKTYGINNYDSAQDILQTLDGGYIVAGNTDPSGVALNDFWILKLSSSGDIQWQKSYGGNDFEAAYSVQQTTDTGYIITGPSDSFGFGSWVIKIDNTGNVQWEYFYDGSPPFEEPPSYIRKVNSGGYLLGSTLDGPGYGLIKLDSVGEIEWQKSYSLSSIDLLKLLEILPDDSILLGGNGSLHFLDFWILKLNSAGDISLPCPVIATTFRNKLPTSAIVFATNVTPTDSAAITVDIQSTLTDTSIVPEDRCSPPPCLLCDDFEDGVLDPNWSYFKPAWDEQFGDLRGSPVRRKAIAIATPIFSGCSLCTIDTGVVTSPGNLVSLLVWYVDKRNTVELLLKEEADKWVLKQRIDGIVVAKQKADWPFEPNIVYPITIAFDGSKFEVFENGTRVMTMTKAPGTQPMGTVGYKVKGGLTYFRYITVN